MHGAHAFLVDLATVFGVAGVITVVCEKLRLPVVLGYLIAGMVVGPHLPVPLVADRETIETLAELGVILLLFSVGLEFSFGRLLAVAPTAGLVALLETSLLGWLGFSAARLLGAEPLASVYLGAAAAISSTTIIARVFEEQKIGRDLRELVFGVLVVEDLIAVLLLALLTALSAGGRPSGGALLLAAGRLLGFLVGMVVVGLLVVPRLIRAVVRLGRAETTLVAAVGLCFGGALLAGAFGYSVALGAFVAGALVGESGVQHEVEKQVRPVRDLFAALFFVSVGMLLDPAAVARHWDTALALLLVVLLGKPIGVGVGAFLAGAGVRNAVRAGLSQAQIGEFSFIIAALGASTGASGEALYPAAVAVSATTTLFTPWLVRGSSAAANRFDRRLPRALQTFAALYTAWVEALREAPRERTLGVRVRRLLRWLLVDAACAVGAAAGGSVAVRRLARPLSQAAGISPGLAALAIGALAALIAAPFCIGIVRLAGGLGSGLAEAVVPPSARGLDPGAAPRRALVVALQLGAVAVLGAPIAALAQPFLPRLSGGFVLFFTLLGLGAALWRRASELEGHVRAGAEAVAEALAAGSQKGAPAPTVHSLDAVQELLPGLGDLSAVELPAASAAVGRTLVELDLRGRTGATVLAIVRGGEPLRTSPAREALRGGDRLALAGSHEAVEAARTLLTGIGATAAPTAISPGG